MSSLQIFARKKREQMPLAMVALSDAPSAQIACDAGIDAILVGDSLGNTALGYDSTLPVTLDDMAHHLGAVLRGVKASSRPDVPVVADMPFGSYSDSQKGVEAAVRLMQIGAHAVKIEGVQSDYQGHAGPIFGLLRHAGIPVMGHIGFTPQSALQFESVVQGKSGAQAFDLTHQAQTLERAGCFALVLEAMTREVAREISDQSKISVIGIGAGVSCDGQILVWHDLVGISDKTFKMARAYAQTRQIWTQALQEYRSDVENRAFPSEENGWSMAPDEIENWSKLREARRKKREEWDDFDDSDPFADDEREVSPLNEQPF